VAGRLVRFWASEEAKFPKMGDSLPKTPMNLHAKFDAASFIIAGEIRNCTNTHNYKKKLAYRHVWIISKSLSLSTAELVKQRSATSSVKFRFSVVWYTSVIDCRNHKSATDRFTVLRCVVLAHYRTQYQHCSIAVYTLTDSGQANLP